MNVLNTALHKESLGNRRFITEEDRKQKTVSSCLCHNMTVWTILCIGKEVKCEVSKDDTVLL